VAGHPECAARVPAILEALEVGGLTAEARPQQVGTVLFDDQLTATQPYFEMS
jgi:hypothetical protein